MSRGFPGSWDSRKEEVIKGIDTVRGIVIICAPCSYAKTICGTGVRPATGTWLPRNIPSTKMNRLYITRFLFHLILALHTEGKDGRCGPPGSLYCRLKLSGGSLAGEELDCC